MAEIEVQAANMQRSGEHKCRWDLKTTKCGNEKWDWFECAECGRLDPFTEQLNKKLTVCVAKLMREGVVDAAVSVEDLVHGAASAWYEGRVNWDIGRDPFRLFLAVVRHKYFDKQRHSKHVAGSMDDPSFRVPVPTQAIDSHIEKKFEVSQILNSIQFEPDEQMLLTAIIETADGSPRTDNKELAEMLSWHVKKVVNVKKRVYRKLAKLLAKLGLRSRCWGLRKR